MKTTSAYLVLWFFLISAVSVTFSITAFKKRNHPGYRYLSPLLLITGLLFLLGGINLYIKIASTLIILNYVIDTLAVFIPVLWLFFAICFSRNKKTLDHPDLALLFIIPIITILNIWTNEFGSFWYTDRVISKTATGILLWIRYQNWFWIHYTYSNALFFIGLLYIFSSFSKKKQAKRVSLIVLTVAFIALTVFELFLLSGEVGSPSHYLIRFIYSLLGFALLLFIYRFNYLDLGPFSRNHFFDQIPDYIIIIDNEFRIVDANIAFATWKGYPKEDLFGESIFTLFPQWDREISLLTCQSTMKFNEEIQSSCGNQFIEIDSMPLVMHNQKVYGRLFVFHDVTALSHNASMKIDFINTISHELRTPLTVIKQAISYLNLEYHEGSNPDQSKVLNIAHRNADRLNQMVNNLLEFQNLRLKKENLRFESYSLNCLIQDSILVLKPWIDQGNIRIIEELEPLLPNAEIDVDKIKQVIVNIIDNAVRFTEKGFVIVRTNDYTTFARMIVEDTGVGISKEEQARLSYSLDEFELLIQKNKSHVGLGLIVSKEIIFLHGGSIHAKTKADGGTIITIDLPYSQSVGT